MLESGYYRISAQNLLVHELIGLQAKVVSSTDKGMKGIMGKVVDETMNLLVLEKADGMEKKVPKKSAEFMFELGDEKVLLKGSLLECRPEQRTKVLWRKMK